MRLCTRCDTRHPDPALCPASSSARPRQTAALPTGMIQPSMRAPRPPPDDGKKLVGRVLGSYKLLEVIGRGGMGHVYAAEHVKLGRRVALKLLKPEYAVKRDAVARFFQEARAVNKIRHRNIVDVTDFFELPDHQAFIIMELLEGRSLGRIYRADEPLTTPVLLGVLVQVCEALEAAHAVGIVHRDLKPDNIFVVEGKVRDDGVPLAKLLDFGIAKLISEEYTDNDTWRTSHNNFLGTPAFMSPEQAICDTLDGRSDVYSLGAILYELLCGQPLFDGKSFGDFVLQHKNRPPRAFAETLRGGAVPQAVQAIVLRCLAKQPADRYPTVTALKQDLLAMLEPRAERTEVELVAEATLVPAPAPAPPRAHTPNPSLAWQLAPLAQEVTLARPRLALKLGALAALAIAVLAAVELGTRDSLQTIPALRTSAEPVVATAEATPAPAPAPPPPAAAKPPAPTVAASASRPSRPAAKRAVVAEAEPPRASKRGKRPGRAPRGATEARLAIVAPAAAAAPAVDTVVPDVAPAPAPPPPSREIGRGETMNPFGGRK
jgi:serine/threonine protein kinase